MRHQLLLTDARQLRALADPTRQRVLALLVERPAGVAAIAQQLGVPVTRLYHHVHHLHDAGLIAVVAERPRRGAPERVYRAVARNVAIDRRKLQSGTTLVREPAMASLSASLSAVLSVALGDLRQAALQGRLGVEDGGEDAAVVSYRHIRASPATARQLRRRLSRWLAACAAAHDPNASSEYGLFVAFYPAPDGTRPSPATPRKREARPKKRSPAGPRFES